MGKLPNWKERQVERFPVNEIDRELECAPHYAHPLGSFTAPMPRRLDSSRKRARPQGEIHRAGT